MIFSFQLASEQAKKLLMKYPDLHISEMNRKQIQIKGSILVHRAVDDYTLRKRYEIEIIIPINSDRLPYVIDASKGIARTYRHINNSGILCLETDISILRRFTDGFDLILWMDEFVEPYYVTYEYYSEYGRFPYGERDHGSEGVLQSYQEIFETNNYIETFNLACYIRNHRYRGHHRCPCGSGKRIRDCHGTIMRVFYDQKILMKQMIMDMDKLETELRAYHARYNTETSK